MFAEDRIDPDDPESRITRLQVIADLTDDTTSDYVQYTRDMRKRIKPKHKEIPVIKALVNTYNMQLIY